MLILMRRTGEKLMIGEEATVTVTVLSVKGNHVRIGVDAPRAVPVHREEIYERIRRATLGEPLDPVEPAAPDPQAGAGPASR